MGITPMASGFLTLSSVVGLTIGAALLPWQLTTLQAAETSTGESAAPVSAEAADQAGLKKGTTVVDKKNPDGSREQLATAKLEGCKSQFKLADQNGDGLLDQSEIAHYNSSIEHENQAPLPENDRLNEATFIAACSAIGAHE